jgi:hypothetical protein
VCIKCIEEFFILLISLLNIIYFIYMYDNYTWTKASQATSCGANPFCIAKPILRKNKSTTTKLQTNWSIVNLIGQIIAQMVYSIITFSCFSVMMVFLFNVFCRWERERNNAFILMTSVSELMRDGTGLWCCWRLFFSKHACNTI